MRNDHENRVDRIFDEVDWNKQDEIGNIVHGLDALIDGEAMDASRAMLVRTMLDNLVQIVDARELAAAE